MTLRQVHLAPENASGLGEDTFWTWLRREYAASNWFDAQHAPGKDDVVLHYSTLGAPAFPDQTVALCWELHPEMERALGTQFPGAMHKIRQAASTARVRTIASALMLEDYAQYGPVHIMPIGVDTQLFYPRPKQVMREKYGLSLDKKIGFWAGTPHPMKGQQNLIPYAQQHSEIEWIIIWKQRGDQGHFPGKVCFTSTHIPQNTIAELMSAADFFACPGLLRPYFMVEWEALACNLPPLLIGNPEKDFIPGNNPRQDLIDRGWARVDALGVWTEFIQKM